VFTLHLGLLSIKGPFSQKTCFPKEEFSNEMFLNFLHIIFIVAPICLFFLQSNLKKYEFLKVHKFCQILCFILKNFHNFKSYQIMLTLSSLIFYSIRCKFLKTTYTLYHIYMSKRTHELF